MAAGHRQTQGGIHSATALNHRGAQHITSQPLPFSGGPRFLGTEHGLQRPMLHWACFLAASFDPDLIFCDGALCRGSSRRTLGHKPHTPAKLPLGCTAPQSYTGRPEAAHECLVAAMIGNYAGTDDTLDKMKKSARWMRRTRTVWLRQTVGASPLPKNDIPLHECPLIPQGIFTPCGSGVINGCGEATV